MDNSNMDNDIGNIGDKVNIYILIFIDIIYINAIYIKNENTDRCS